MLLRLGKAEISLKEAQVEALKAIVMERKDSLVILPTGYGKSLFYLTLPFIFDYLDASSTANMIIVVSPLNALMQELMGSGYEIGSYAQTTANSFLVWYVGVYVRLISIDYFLSTDNKHRLHL